jgi:tRNA pseudouridine13 synthase
MQPTWPYLTTDVPPIPGAIKRRVQDFRVEEVAAYDPCGSGEHVYAHIEKTGVTTRQAVLALGRALEVPPERIGAAGRKDARGIARQMLSVEGVEPSRVRALALPGIRVLDVARHHSKLRPGSLRGNRFTIRLRETPTNREADVRSVLECLARRGVPNYFGSQRFGMRGDTWEVGRLLVAGDFAAAAALVVGQPAPEDPLPVRRARALAAEGRYREAASAWPTGFADCARLCRSLAATRGDARRALLRLDRSVLGFYVSAYQAWLFNRVLAERLPTFDHLLAGDIACSHASGLCVRVVDPAPEQPRADRFEISPTGPIVGFAMPTPQDEAGAIEARSLAEAGCSPDGLPRSGPLACVGARRPFRFPLEQLRIGRATDDVGRYLELRFTLPPGCYATVVLREICKDGLQEGDPDPEDVGLASGVN